MRWLANAAEDDKHGVRWWWRGGGEEEEAFGKKESAKTSNITNKP